MKSLLPISALVLVALNVVCAAELDSDLIWDPEESIWKLEPGYEALAQVLGPRMAELSEPDTIEGAMKAVASLRKKWPQKADGLLGVFGVSGQQPTEAMDLFEQLGIAYNKCDYRSFQVVRRNFFLAVGQNPARLDASKSKLHSIVRQAWEQHSATCRSHHIEAFTDMPIYEVRMFEETRDIINKETISTMFGTTDLKTILSMKPTEVSERLPKSGEFWVRRTYEVSQGTIGAAHFKVKGDKIKLTSEAWKVGDWPVQAIKLRITNKCMLNYKHRDIFRPVMFDFVLDDEKLDEITQGNELFEHTLAAFKVCSALMEHEKELIHNVREYVQILPFFLDE